MREQIDPIEIQGRWFKDSSGRTLMFRGINVTAKVPASYKSGILNNKPMSLGDPVTYVDCPFPLSEADEHFKRIHYWGFNIIRLVVPWEAIEHEGPGIYDANYLDYLEEMVRIASSHNLYIFIDFHQDVFSRAFSGSGAPLWTIDKVGFDLNNLEKTGACVLHKFHVKKNANLLWPTNGWKYAAATMFTLFFGGNTFAPQVKVDGVPVQDYLQDHLIGSILQVVKRLKKFSHVLGYELINEPLPGYIGCKDIRKQFGLYHLGASPTPFEAMSLASGHSLKIAHWKRGMFNLRQNGTVLLNDEKRTAWKKGYKCPWKERGVWGEDSSGQPIPLKTDYFSKIGKCTVNFSDQFLAPFITRVQEAISKECDQSLFFIQNPVGELPPKACPKHEQKTVYSIHWYDGFVFFLKKFSSFLAIDIFKRKLVFSLPKKIRRLLSHQIKKISHSGKKKLGKCPTFLSEFGISFDLYQKKSYKTGDFWAQTKALDRSYRAVEDNLLSSCLWNYTPINSNSHGDYWNEEDFSIFCPCQHVKEDLMYSGLRAKKAIVRPYAIRVSGEPIKMGFNLRKKTFTLKFHSNIPSEIPTEVFLPTLYTKKGLDVHISDGAFDLNVKDQVLHYFHTSKKKFHTLKITFH
ncbi:MAG: hypothetical protein S4CHLAM102_16410 [Chlamydiia bacterium]|nr:hypothetical protein [Chlamydiia bacterium]